MSIDSALEGLARKLGQRVNTVGYVCGAEHEIAEGLRASKLGELIAAGQALASPYADNIDLLIFDYKQALAAFLAATEGK